MEKSNFITPWQEVHTIVDDAIAYSLGPMRNRCGSPMSGAKSHTTTIAQNWV